MHSKLHRQHFARHRDAVRPALGVVPQWLYPQHVAWRYVAHPVLRGPPNMAVKLTMHGSRHGRVIGLCLAVHVSLPLR